MAEYVQQSIEEMLPELEQMERVGICTGIETRKILKKRTNYEYKLRRRTKCKEDFMQYIKYEVDVLKLIHTRRQKVRYHHKRTEIEYAITCRIHNLFRLVTNRFPDDVKLWLSHIEFSQSRKEKANVSKFFTKMLQVHNKKADLWILAAKWEWENNNSPNNARHLLQQGIRYLTNSQQLWLEYFRMELLYAEKLRQRRSVLGIDEEEADKVADTVLEGFVAEVVYKKAIEAIPDNVDFVLSFLPICQLFDFTTKLQEDIFSSLRREYSDKPQTWDAIAKQCLYTTPYTDENEAKFHEVYEEALKEKVIPKDVTWKFYLTACLELIEDESQTLTIREKRIHKVLSLFESAATGDFLSDDLYLKWIKVLVNVGLVETALQTVQRAVSQHALSMLLWRQYLLLSMRTQFDVTDAILIFKESQKHVPEKESLEIWRLLLDFCVTCQSEKTEELFEKGICSHRQVALPLKEYYLQWLYLAKGVQKARTLFQRLIQTKPVSLQLFYEYIKIENAQATSKIKLLRRAYEDATMEFGNSSADLWLDFIRMEMTHPKGQPENVGTLHYRAIHQLDGELNQQFVTEFTLLQTGHDMDTLES
ncbi:U3 small nucleolar RNA-associated protein 6 homolog [Mytilus galloprovincialis]|uniref:U3 small nucleolar RNA-associated protein 6 homolog n=1 Tax=Mytilus galloprovincialis TaxID=29158 RepID=UPI003F7CCE2A